MGESTEEFDEFAHDYKMRYQQFSLYTTKRECKNICKEFKTEWGYKGATNVFCKKCNIFMTKSGTYIKAGLRCKCCKQRVRLKEKRYSGLKPKTSHSLA